MKVVAAFDSFKGTLTAREACAAACHGLTRGGFENTACPLSDGGEGFVESLVSATAGASEWVRVTGPLGDSTLAEIGWLEHGRVALVESAQACGLTLVPRDRRDPERATTVGVGEMIAYAIEAGAQQVVVGLGGTATNDGGMGMLHSLGWKFLDASGAPLTPIAAALADLHVIEPSEADIPVDLVAACDVSNALCGPSGATRVFGPQKGATAEQVERLDRALERYALIAGTVCERLGRTADHQRPGTGAAGGLGFALSEVLGARYESGAQLALGLVRLREQLRTASLCLTGEGRTDGQTAFGKLPAAVAALCDEIGVPCVCICGTKGEGWEAMISLGCRDVVELGMTGEEHMAQRHVAHALADTALAIAEQHRER